MIDDQPLRRAVLAALPEGPEAVRQAVRVWADWLVERDDDRGRWLAALVGTGRPMWLKAGLPDADADVSAELWFDLPPFSARSRLGLNRPPLGDGWRLDAGCLVAPLYTWETL